MANSRRKIGSLEVPAVGLGASNFGRTLDEAGSVRLIQAALEAGVNFFDTADVYNDGLSEAYLGKAVKGHRDSVIVATKFGRRLAAGRAGGDRVWSADVSRRWVREAVEGSLRRLQCEYIDLYILHTPDERTPVGETLLVLDELKRGGKIREIGCSSVTVEYLREAWRIVEDLRVGSFVNVQNRYNLLDLHRDGEGGVIEECAEGDIAFVPFSPLASGMLSGKYSRGVVPAVGTRLAGPPVVGYSAEDLLTDEKFDMVERLATFAADSGHSVLELAVAWLLSFDSCASVIAGATGPSQLLENVRAAEWVLAEKELEELRRLTGQVGVD